MGGANYKFGVAIEADQDNLMLTIAAAVLMVGVVALLIYTDPVVRRHKTLLMKPSTISYFADIDVLPKAFKVAVENEERRVIQPRRAVGEYEFLSEKIAEGSRPREKYKVIEGGRASW
jgi:hypothetical protein